MNKGVQVQTSDRGPSKDVLIGKIDSAIKSYNDELTALRQKYESDLSECSHHLLKMQNLNEKQAKELYDKDEQIRDLKEEIAKWKHEADFYKKNAHRSIVDMPEDNITENDYKIRECKDKIFKFLINERNNGSDNTRLEFYQSIISLLMTAADTEKDSSFDLKSLMNYFTNEGKKVFGNGYIFHNTSKDKDSFIIDQKYDPDFEQNLEKSNHKHNKSETRIATINDFNRMISADTTKYIPSNDITSLTEIGSNKSRKRKKGLKKTKLLENKVKELSEAIEKQKEEFKQFQNKIKQDTIYSPSPMKASRNNLGADRMSFLNTKSTNMRSQEFPRKENMNLNEDILQYLH